MNLLLEQISEVDLSLGHEGIMSGRILTLIHLAV